MASDDAQLLALLSLTRNAQQYPSILQIPGLVVCHDYTKNIDYLRGQAATNNLTVTRASAGTYTNTDNSVTSFSSNTARIGTLGLRVEETRTNAVLYSRDLTNAAWIKSNTTALKNQIGADGVSNSASSLTATASDGTVLQSITLASSARYQTAFVKRLVGSGTISMTMDGGTTWTPITITNDWTRVSIPTQTLANTQVGFRIATSGDSIAVDYIQNENGSFATNPIETSSSSAARAQETSKLSSIAPIDLNVGTLYAEFITLDNTQANSVISLDDNTSNNRIQLRANTGTYGFTVVAAGAAQASPSITTPITGIRKIAGTYKLNEFNFALDGVLGTLDSSGTIPTFTQAAIGCGAGLACLNGYVRTLAIFNRALSASEIQLLTTITL